MLQFLIMKNLVKNSTIFLISIFLSSSSLIPLNREAVRAQPRPPLRGIVVDPPSNVRISPNGPILCTIENEVHLNLYDLVDGWYQTDKCQGRMGYIHRSQVRLEEDVRVRGVISDPPSNVRISPNGPVLCSIKARVRIDLYGLQNGWYRTNICGRAGYIHQSQVLIR